MRHPENPYHHLVSFARGVQHVLVSGWAYEVIEVSTGLHGLLALGENNKLVYHGSIGKVDDAASHTLEFVGPVKRNQIVRHHPEDKLAPLKNGDIGCFILDGKLYIESVVSSHDGTYRFETPDGIQHVAYGHVISFAQLKGRVVTGRG